MTADFHEVAELAADLGKGAVRVGVGAAKAVRKTTLATQRDAKANVAVRSGHTRDSITTSFTGDGRSGSMTGEVGPEWFVGLYLEEGTSVRGPQPYLAPAMDKNSDPFLRAVGDLSKDIL